MKKLTPKSANHMNETKIVCPQCGAEFAIPEHEHISIGIAIGKDSGLRTIHPAVVGQSPVPTNKTNAQMKVEAKLEALKQAGVDVSNLFAMKGTSGQEMIVRLQNGAINPVEDDDPIFSAIFRRGTVPNRRLFRRWVMSQVFHMMAYKGYGGEGFTAALKRKGYEYQWKMVVEEMRVQAKLSIRDHENFEERNHWFDTRVVCAMAEDYMTMLRDHIKDLPRKKCKGTPYIRIGHINVFEADIHKKIYEPLQHNIIRMATAKNPTNLVLGVLEFYDRIKKLWMNYSMPMSPVFIDAYKGAGAYFTMKNLILFHGCRMVNGCVKLDEAKSIKKLNEKAALYKVEGWRLFGVLKKLLADNNVNIYTKMAEWRK